MKHEIKVPSMGESISEAHVGTIIKPTGSRVAMDDEILELETDKVNQVLYAPQGGIITLRVNPEDVVKIGQVIGFVDTESSATAAAPIADIKETPETPAPAPVEQKKEKKVESKASSENDSSVRLTKEVWLDEIKAQKSPSPMPQKAASAPVEKIVSTQSGDRIETRLKMSKIRKLIASRMVEVQQNTAMLTTFNEVDMTAVMSLRETYKESFLKVHGVKLGFMSFFVEACASALEAFPAVNSYIDGDEIVRRGYVDIGVAVGTDKGVIVPVVRNCNQLSFAQVEKSIESYAAKARKGGLSADDLQGGGFTITNGGVYGSLLSTPIINPPQCAILGMHKIMKRAVVIEDQIVIRQMMYLALSYDHRLIDGKEAVSFLIHIKNRLEDPTRLLLEV